jgi:hypothetical protein
MSPFICIVHPTEFRSSSHKLHLCGSNCDCLSFSFPAVTATWKCRHTSQCYSALFQASELFSISILHPPWEDELPRCMNTIISCVTILLLTPVEKNIIVPHFRVETLSPYSPLSFFSSWAEVWNPSSESNVPISSPADTVHISIPSISYISRLCRISLKLIKR